MAGPVEASVGVPEAREEPSRVRYDAFVSYSHAADGRLAPALQLGLHRFAKPWYRLRALRVFRDEASLSANPALWAAIERSLASARWFVLLASPAAAASEWVAREVAWWCEHNGAAQLLLVVTDGTVAWDDDAADFDRSATDALPPTAFGAFAEEPRWIDLRWARTSEDVSLRNDRFRSAVAEIAAPLHDRPKDDLIGEDVRQHRRTVRLARAGITTLVALLVASVALGVLARDQRNQARVQRDAARAERDRADRQARIATSRLLASEATADFARSLDRGLLVALEAFRLAPTFEARATLVQAVQNVQRVPAILRSHDGEVLGVEFSPDGRRLLSSGDDNQVRFWDVRANRVAGKTVSCNCLTTSQGATFTAHGTRVVSAYGFDATSVTIWDAAKRRPVRELEDPAGAVDGVAVSRDGKLLATFGEDRAVVLWDLTRARPLGRLPGASSSATQVEFSPDVRVLAVDSQESGLELWDVAGRRRLGRLLAPGTWTRTFAFTPDGRAIAVAGDDAVRLWSTATRRPGMLRIPTPHNVQSLAFDRKGQLLAVGFENGEIRIWDVRVGRPLGASLTGHEGFVDDLAFSPDSATLASAGQDGTVRLWATRAQALGTLILASRPSGLAFDRSGKTLAVGMLEHPSRVLTAPRWTSRSIGGNAKSYVLDTAISPDGRLVALADISGRITIRDAATGRLVRTLGDARATRAEHVAFSRDGRLLAASGWHQTIRIWRVPTWELVDRPLESDLGRLEGVTGGFDVVGFLADGRLVTAGSVAVRLWRIDGDRVRNESTFQVSPSVNAAALSRDGRIVALGAIDSRIRLLDLRTRKVSEPLAGHTDEVDDLAFSPDGRLLASLSSLEGAIRLWDVATGRQLSRALRGDELGNPLAVAWSPDGRALLSANSDGLVSWDPILWRGDLAAFRARLCPVAGRNLSRSEWARFLPGRTYERTCPREPVPG